MPDKTNRGDNGKQTTNKYDVIKVAVICTTVCILSMFGTASNWKDGSEIRTSGISVGSIAAILYGLNRFGKL